MIKLIRLVATCVLSGILSVSCATSTAPASKTATVRKAIDYPAWSASAPAFTPAHTVLRSVKTTAYCHKEADSLKYGTRCAVGCNLRYDQVRSAAADWSVYPVGTVFRIVGQPYTYRIDDYGSALVGTGTIDLFQPTLAQVHAWGARCVQVEVLRWGSFQKSLEILSPRTRAPHVSKMVSNIRKVQRRLS